MVKPNFLSEIKGHKPFLLNQERYLPSAFDESLSVIEKINRLVMFMHQYTNLTDDMLGKWNEVYNWVMNDGLDGSIGDRLKEWLDDGTFDRIINQELLNDIKGDILQVIEDFEKVKNDLNVDFNELKVKINNDFNVLKENLTNLIEENTKNKSQIIVSTEEPEYKDGVHWWEVIE